jgi:hypothetical protein
VKKKGGNPKYSVKIEVKRVITQKWAKNKIKGGEE